MNEAQPDIQVGDHVMVPQGFFPNGDSRPWRKAVVDAVFFVNGRGSLHLWMFGESKMLDHSVPIHAVRKVPWPEAQPAT